MTFVKTISENTEVRGFGITDKQLSVLDDDQQWLIYQWQCIKVEIATLYLHRKKITLTS